MQILGHPVTLLSLAWWLPFCVLALAVAVEAFGALRAFRGANGIILVMSVSVPVLAQPLAFGLGWLAGDFAYALSVMWMLAKGTLVAWGGLFLILGLLVSVLRRFGYNP